MGNRYDAIIIGAGHNGLVAAAYLAKAGRSVLVLERRQVVGGAASSEEIFGGCRVDTGAHDVGLFRSEIVRGLGLSRLGLEFLTPPLVALALQADGRALEIWRETGKTCRSLAGFSKRDAERFPDYRRRLAGFVRVLDGMMTLTPPAIRSNKASHLLSWSRLALRLKGLGRREMMDFLRVLPLSVKDFLDEWFESQALKGALASVGIAGGMQGPYASGTSFTYLYHQIGEPGGGFRASRFVKGGAGRLSEILADAARGFGADIRTGSDVRKVLIDDRGQAVGVAEGGGEHRARVVVSNADPRRTLFDLVGAPYLEPRVMRRVKNIRFRGSTAKVNLLLGGLPRLTAVPPDRPEFLAGHLVIAPDVGGLERAYDDAKYGRISENPILDIVLPTLHDPGRAPKGKHLASISMQFAPYHLRDGDWDENREALGDKIVRALTEYAPNLPEIIEERQVLTPLDWERDYGLTEGGIYQGQMGLDQMLLMRPIPGYGQYRSPVPGLFLCGAGAHPGGGVTGAPGFNAAREILLDLRG